MRSRALRLILTALLASLLPWGSEKASAVELSLTFLPGAAIDYEGEGKGLPQSYVNRFEGTTSPLYRLDLRQSPSPGGYWGASLWHTGVAGGGDYGIETVPDRRTGGVYQSSRLNVGFTNFFLTYRRPLKEWPLEATVHFSIVREIFMRKDFRVQGPGGIGIGPEDVTEVSAEGLGIGLAGRHGKEFFLRWEASAHQYVQLFDANTDAMAGHIFQAEGGAGAELAGGLSLEAGVLWQYWFLLSQGGRRLALPGTDGALITWNRQETRTSGLYLRLSYRF